MSGGLALIGYGRGALPTADRFYLVRQGAGVTSTKTPGEMKLPH